ncbi:MetQ/NlpA family ABC transporter substrate-binding protein [Alkalihalophilus marmarensis]|jgi:D-methionine transport system substrate-binding protein|uniref:Lipoprotein n=1 Tax=Alkalihalophilus marmarensis DSM 21297 TaxID=1188261 RepID=U6SNV1_9BACI|nr:MetQ/NlpA family ABC transporter substrate-binding protein [Alkalihalophilus marmarensis]ERN52590.1 methionine ABC transporter ATPase [Alkalihalophilus marmarensis DSM 21297]MCM3490952.1 MetQ/NlpA family ABC transporter substrate-binding protein [Alkalihalophilus marmarensis]
MKKLKTVLLSALLVGALAACGSGETEETSAAAEDKSKITFGSTAGPYSDMVSKAIKPVLEEKGYEVEVVEFSDYVQPNIALNNGSIDANLFQHKIYMDNFAEENNMELSEIIVVPTAPMGIYSNKYDSLDEIEEGTQIAIPNDPTNAARAFLILEEEGLIKVDPDVNPLVISERDVIENPKNIVFQPIEAGQLPRAVDSVDLSAVPGNFALSANMDLLDALKLETMPDEYRNRVVVSTENLDQSFVEDIKEAVESSEFEEVIDSEFEGFGKPEWME